jgi:hypothetical protein
MLTARLTTFGTTPRCEDRVEHSRIPSNSPLVNLHAARHSPFCFRVLKLMVSRESTPAQGLI